MTATIASIIADFDAIEVWRPITGWPRYEISSWGRVRRGARILKTGIVRGYHVVTLSDGPAHQTKRVHRLTIEEFWGPPPFPGAIVAHNDGDIDHNRIGNLRWASASENQADRVRHDTRTRGSQVFGAKLTEAEIPEIRRRLATGQRYPAIARDFGVSVSTISLIKRGRIWVHV